MDDKWAPGLPRVPTVYLNEALCLIQIWVLVHLKYKVKIFFSVHVVLPCSETCPHCFSCF